MRQAISIGSADSNPVARESHRRSLLEDVEPLNDAQTARRLLGNIGNTTLYKLSAPGGRLKIVRIGRRSFWTGDSIIDVATNGAP